MNSAALRACQAVDDDETDDYPVLRVMVSARGLPMPPTTAPRSVFEFKPAETPARQDKAKEPVSRCHSGRVSLAADGGLQVVGMAYPSGRWTQERADQEQARRARQRPPKPTRAARTKSLKLRELIGDDDE